LFAASRLRPDQSLHVGSGRYSRRAWTGPQPGRLALRRRKLAPPEGVRYTLRATRVEARSQAARLP
jgi:hypothetical protein